MAGGGETGSDGASERTRRRSGAAAPSERTAVSDTSVQARTPERRASSLPYRPARATEKAGTQTAQYSHSDSNGLA
jgi:hypothetical protein